MRSIYRAAFLAAALVFLSPCAFACSDSDVSIGDLKTDVSDEDQTVFISGYVQNGCLNEINVTVTLNGEGADQSVISSASFTVQNIPAGGRSFDVTGAVPYNQDVQQYTIGKLTVHDAGPLHGGHLTNRPSKWLPQSTPQQPATGQP